MNLSRSTLSALVGISALFLAHCSSKSDDGNAQGGAPSGGNSTGGNTANGGSGTGGSSTGGSTANGGSGTGGSGTGGSGTGGASNGGSTASGGAASGGVTANGGANNGGANNGGANNGGSAGATSKGGATASGGTAGSSSGGGASKGGSAGQSSSGGQGGGSSSGFALTSEKLAPGMAFPAEETCAHPASATDKSPPFAWTNPPSGTMSFALVLVDMSISATHWILWDIPGSTMSLPEALPSGASLSMPSGAKQVAGFGGMAQYVGPCPSGTQHTYVFTLYALDVATLPNVTTSSSAANVLTAIQAHDLASATLSGTSDAKKP